MSPRMNFALHWIHSRLHFRVAALAGLLLLGATAALPQARAASFDPAEVTKKAAENQIRHLIEPLLEKYCHDQCRLLSVGVTVDVAVPEEIAPGFDEVHVRPDRAIAPSSATLKILMDDKIGPVSRGKLLELLQQYLDTLDFAVRIDLQLAHFPQPLGTEGKVAELRERLAKRFLNTIDEVFQQFCPEQCILVDFSLRTEAVNGEESQYGSPGEFIQEGGVALKLREISGTLVLDESLSPEERTNILEVAKLKTNSFKNVILNSKVIKFPRPLRTLSGAGRGIAGASSGYLSSKDLESSTSSSKINNSNQETTHSTNQNTTTANSTNTTSNNSSNNTSATQKNDSKSSSTSSEASTKQERFERIEKIERVESGDAVQAELQKFKVFGLVFACSILALLIFIAIAAFRGAPKEGGQTVHKIIQGIVSDPTTQPAASVSGPVAEPAGSNRGAQVSARYEIEQLVSELSAIFAQQPRVAKHVFSRILTEEGVEVTGQYVHIFGEAIVIDMLRDPSLQADLNGLMEYYAKTPIEIEDDEKLDLLRRLHHRTVAGKLSVMGNRSSNLFDFLVEMDPVQILELIRTESMTVKAIAVTQCDAQKRSTIFSLLDEESRLRLLTELSRIDYLPRDYIYNVSSALKRKKRDNPRLNTEALPGSEVLVTMLERTGSTMQKTVMRHLEATNPENARLVKGKLVSIETLRFLRDSQLLEVVLSLRHDELLQFLKGASDSVRNTIFAKAPKELTIELEEELAAINAPSREGYQSIERKILNRVKLMATDGLINLAETNDRMFAEASMEGSGAFAPTQAEGQGTPAIQKVGGW